MDFNHGCQRSIGGYADLNCFSCIANGKGNCDYGHCPNIYSHSYGRYVSTSHHHSTKKCVICQADIGGCFGRDCQSCEENGAGLCDVGQCPSRRKWSMAYDNFTNKCVMCQRKIGGYYYLNCESCSLNGGNKCDPGHCPSEEYLSAMYYTSYDKTTQKCVVCQKNIGDVEGLNCKSCTHNGKGKCDHDYCPKTHFINILIKLVTFAN